MSHLVRKRRTSATASIARKGNARYCTTSKTHATREFQLFGGSEALDEPYLQISPLGMVKRRAGWLVVLFLGEMLSATAMGFFEKEIAKATPARRHRRW